MACIKIWHDSGSTRIETTREFGNDVIELNILVPTENQTLLEIQAQAFEKAAEHLVKLANSIRLQIAQEFPPDK